jgi:hypothetical protein
MSAWYEGENRNTEGNGASDKSFDGREKNSCVYDCLRASSGSYTAGNFNAECFVFKYTIVQCVGRPGRTWIYNIYLLTYTYLLTLLNYLFTYLYLLTLLNYLFTSLYLLTLLNYLLILILTYSLTYFTYLLAYTYLPAYLLTLLNLLTYFT